MDRPAVCVDIFLQNDNYIQTLFLAYQILKDEIDISIKEECELSKLNDYPPRIKMDALADPGVQLQTWEVQVSGVYTKNCCFLISLNSEQVCTYNIFLGGGWALLKF